MLHQRRLQRRQTPNIKQMLQFSQANRLVLQQIEQDTERSENQIKQQHLIENVENQFMKQLSNHFLWYPRCSSQLQLEFNPEDSSAKEQQSSCSNRRKIYSRENFCEMNKKLRLARMSHYKQNNGSSRQSLDGHNQKIQVCSVHKQQLRNLTFRPQQYNLQIKNNENYQSMRQSKIQYSTNAFPRKKPSSSLHQKGYSVITRKVSSPLVIYPFEAKLKAKHIDDNPKVLGNLIKKKYENASKEQLYRYINNLIQRRDLPHLKPRH